MKTYYIYTLTNPRDNKIFYVGFTTNSEKRKLAHFYHFYRLLKGLQPVFTIVETIKSDTIRPALTLEKYWITKLISEGNNLLNKTGGGFVIDDRVLNRIRKQYKSAA